LITPHLVSDAGSTIDAAKIETVRQAEHVLGTEERASEQQLEAVTPHPPRTPRASEAEAPPAP
jgi:hypothetical protein